MTSRRQRMIFIGVVLAGVITATTLALFAMNENIIYFYSPTQINAGDYPQNRSIRVGGLVVADSIRHTGEDNLSIEFEVSDTVEKMSIVYTGILPDLFREEQGIVAIGSMRDDGVLVADEVLTKHDENYMPPEVADAIKTAQKNGQVPMPKSHRTPNTSPR